MANTISLHYYDRPQSGALSLLPTLPRTSSTQKNKTKNTPTTKNTISMMTATNAAITFLLPNPTLARITSITLEQTYASIQIAQTKSNEKSTTIHTPMVVVMAHMAILPLPAYLPPTAWTWPANLSTPQKTLPSSQSIPSEQLVVPS
jgi:hypothetical protein